MLRGHVCDMQTLSVGVNYSGWQDFSLRVALFLDGFTRALKLSVPWRER